MMINDVRLSGITTVSFRIGLQRGSKDRKVRSEFVTQLLGSATRIVADCLAQKAKCVFRQAPTFGLAV